MHQNSCTDRKPTDRPAEQESIGLKPWDRQPRESEKAFSAFMAYLQMEGQRSLRKLAGKLGRSDAAISNLSARHHWRDRIDAWNSHLIALQSEQTQLITQKMAVDWANRIKDWREKEFAVAQSGIELARQIIDKLLKGRKRKMTIQDAARLLEVCSKLGRLATGLATDRGELTGADGEAIRVEVSAAIAKVYGKPALPENLGPMDSPLDVEEVTPSQLPEMPPSDPGRAQNSEPAS